MNKFGTGLYAVVVAVSTPILHNHHCPPDRFCAVWNCELDHGQEKDHPARLPTTLTLTAASSAPTSEGPDLEQIVGRVS